MPPPCCEVTTVPFVCFVLSRTSLLRQHTSHEHLNLLNVNKFCMIPHQGRILMGGGNNLVALMAETSSRPHGVAEFTSVYRHYLLIAT